MSSSCESDCEEFEIKLEPKNQVFTKLTEKVRKEYLKFLEKQLEENLRVYEEQYEQEALQREHDEIVRNCAKILEDFAIQESTLTQLYQKVMVKTIADVKQSTKDNKLVKHLEEILKNNDQIRTHSIATQTPHYYETKAIQTEELENFTENIPKLSLDERIDLLQANLTKNSIDCVKKQSAEEKTFYQSSKRRRLNYHQRHKRQKFPPPPPPPSAPNQQQLSPATVAWHSPTPPPPNRPVENDSNSKSNEIRLEDDEIAQELEKLFSEQETNLEEVFGISISSVSSNCHISMETKSNDDSKIVMNEESTVPKSMEDRIGKKPASSHSTEHQYPAPVKDLRCSIHWPCERFMQKRKLSETLNRMIEEDIRWHDILKYQFKILFGNDDDDDFAICSPSMELDEVIINSCMRRISPWVVQHLMKPLHDGLISNRFLFKKFAKKLAHHIIMENQYPDENVIRDAVENYFCTHGAVMTAADLEDIRMIPICNYDEQF